VSAAYCWLLLPGLLALYGFNLWRVYRLTPEVRSRLEDGERFIEPCGSAEGFERVDVRAGSFLVPSSFGSRSVTELKDEEHPGGGRTIHSSLVLREGRRRVIVSVHAMPRRSPVVRLPGLAWWKADGSRVLEKALTSRLDLFGVMTRSVILRGKSDVRLERFRLGALRGFSIEGLLRDRSLLCDFNYFDESRHYRLSVMSTGEGLTAEKARMMGASFRPGPS